MSTDVTPEGADATPVSPSSHVASNAATRPQWRRLARLVVGAGVMVWNAARWRTATAGVLYACSGLGLGVQILAGKNLLQEALQLRAGRGDLASLVPEVLALVAVSAAIVIAGAIADAQHRLIGELTSTYAHDRIMATGASIALERFEDSEFYDRLRRAATAGSVRPWQLVWAILNLTSSVLAAAGIAVALAALEPLLIPLAALAGIPTWIAATRNARAAHSLTGTITPIERERTYLRDLLTQRDAAKEIRAFDLAQHFLRRHQRASREIVSQYRREARQQAMRTLFGHAGSGATSLLTGGAVLWLFQTGRIATATAISALVAMQQLRSQTTALSRGVAAIYEAGLYLDDYAGFVGSGVTAAAPVERCAEPFRQLVADRICFRYPGSDRLALDNVTVELRQGDVVALVGENGSGKTTLAKILSLLYSPTEGRLLWNGVDVEEFDVDALRTNIAVIFQDFVRYALPARDNVALGRSEHLDDEAGIRHALRMVDLEFAFDRLPSGWDTVLAKQFVGGHDLSVGQWQRVALARAFFRRAPLLVLDEPTAAVDPRAEDHLFRQVRQLARGRTVLLITHRFANVRSADRIYVLHEGRIEECGTHDSLLADGGRYAELFNLQAARFRD